MDRWSAANRLYAQGNHAGALKQFTLLFSSGQQEVAPADLALCIARCLYALRRIESAEPWFEKALAPDPNRTNARWAYAMQCLLQGRFTPGWSHYDQRFKFFGTKALRIQAFDMPAWRGESLEGKTILIHGEQGLGDEIMFASVAADLVATAKRCIIACSPSLCGLFERSFPKAVVVSQQRGGPGLRATDRNPPWLETVGPIDYQLPSGSLPRRLRADPASFPRRAFLKADETAVDLLKQQLAAAREGEDRLLVGVAWACNGGAGAAGERNSLPLEMLRPLAAIPGVRLVSLHAGNLNAQAAGILELRMIDASSQMRDFDAAAALVTALDAVVSVDTAMAHLAGALGQRTLLALHREADWRWGRGDTDKYWYPEVRIARQTTAGDWAPVVKSLADHLRACVGVPSQAVDEEPLQCNVLLPTAHGTMIVDRREMARPSGVAAALASHGAFEPGEMEILRQVIGHLPPRALVLDIGADIGAHTLEFAKATHRIDGTVHAFEAQRLRFNALAGNVAINSHVNVLCHHMVVADREAPLPPIEDALQVRQVKIDGLHLTRLDLMRLRLDGRETAALRGGLATIARFKPVICVEFVKSSDALPAMLLGLGYRVFMMNRQNFICVHPQREVLMPSGLQEIEAVVNSQPVPASSSPALPSSSTQEPPLPELVVTV